MKQIILLLLFFIFSVNFIFAQNCDKIYLLVDNMAYYGQNENKATSMFDFLDKEIIPILKNCSTRPSRLFLILIIDKEGNVMKIKNLVASLDEKCKKELSEFLLKSKWNPAIFQGQKVCSELHIPFSCIKWE